MPVRASLLLLGLLVACRKESSTQTTTNPPGCSDRVSAFESALSTPSAGSCAQDTDCKCYPGGVSKTHGCGGVTDTATSEKLASIAADYLKDGCQSGIDCAAWMCTPSCQSGKCTNTPPSPKPASTDGGMTCDERSAEIDKLLASASRKCTTDKDCACFRGSVSKTDRCGGVTDVKTNERFEALAKQWSAAGCKLENVMCPAVVCQPACNKGTCAPSGMVVQ